MTRRDPPDGEDAALSIGALSAAAGVPVETIRTWERRYGVPRAERKPSGHRVYPLSTVPRLRRIAQAIARGHRAAEVVPASERALESLLEALPGHPVSALPGPRKDGETGAPASTADLLDAVRRFDADELRRTFQLDWARLSAIDFLEELAAAFLKLIGDEWASGRLEVRHEHFASAALGDFLREIRGPLDERASGPIVALATLPGERHGLGLQMSALVFALAGCRALVLGVDTPVEQIAALAHEAPVRVVALSLVQPGKKKTSEAVRELRTRLPKKVRLLLGGSGATPMAASKGVEIVRDLHSLDAWLTNSLPGL